MSQKIPSKDEEALLADLAKKETVSNVILDKYDTLDVQGHILIDGHHLFLNENGSAKVCHGSGGIFLLRAE